MKPKRKVYSEQDWLQKKAGGRGGSISREHDALVKAAVHMMTLHGFVVTRTEANMHWNHKGERRAPAARKGWPDITGCAPGGAFVAVEVKTGNGKLTPDQKERRAEIENAGGLWCLCRDLDALNAWCSFALCYSTGRKLKLGDSRLRQPHALFREIDRILVGRPEPLDDRPHLVGQPKSVPETIDERQPLERGALMEPKAQQYPESSHCIIGIPEVT